MQAIQKGAERELNETDTLTVHKVEQGRVRAPCGNFKPQPSSAQPSSGEECFCCGKRGHAHNNCRFRTAKCHQCGKTGHIKAVCKAKSKRTLNHLQDRSSEGLRVPQSQGWEYELFALSTSESSHRPIEVELSLDGQSIRMELDT